MRTQELDIMAHIRPDSRITWDGANGSFWVRVQQPGISGWIGKRRIGYITNSAGDSVTIHVPDQEMAIRLVSVLQVIRQRITTKRDEVAAKLTKGA